MRHVDLTSCNLVQHLINFSPPSIHFPIHAYEPFSVSFTFYLRFPFLFLLMIVPTSFLFLLLSFLPYLLSTTLSSWILAWHLDFSTPAPATRTTNFTRSPNKSCHHSTAAPSPRNAPQPSTTTQTGSCTRTYPTHPPSTSGIASAHLATTTCKISKITSRQSIPILNSSLVTIYSAPVLGRDSTVDFVGKSFLQTILGGLGGRLVANVI